jgi:biopolymer transport protein ExbD
MRLQRHQRHREDESRHGIDLAPMLDFVLNLLIFFIMTAVFIKASGIMVHRPSGETVTTAKGAKSIPVHVLANGDIWVDGRVVDFRAVRANIERLLAAGPKSGVLIIADKDAQTGLLVQVVDEIRLGGISNITFSTAG